MAVYIYYCSLRSWETYYLIIKAKLSDTLAPPLSPIYFPIINQSPKAWDDYMFNIEPDLDAFEDILNKDYLANLHYIDIELSKTFPTINMSYSDFLELLFVGIISRYLPDLKESSVAIHHSQDEIISKLEKIEEAGNNFSELILELFIRQATSTLAESEDYPYVKFLREFAQHWCSEKPKDTIFLLKDKLRKSSATLLQQNQEELGIAIIYSVFNKHIKGKSLPKTLELYPYHQEPSSLDNGADTRSFQDKFTDTQYCEFLTYQLLNLFPVSPQTYAFSRISTAKRKFPAKKLNGKLVSSKDINDYFNNTIINRGYSKKILTDLYFWMLPSLGSIRSSHPLSHEKLNKIFKDCNQDGLDTLIDTFHLLSRGRSDKM